MTDLTNLTPGTWNIDPAHSTVGFTVRHLMVSKVRGRFATFSGALTVATDPLQSSVAADVDLASVDTGDEGRDGHLRGTDFFDAEAHPTMRFASTGVKQKGGDYVLLGDLTIKGETRHVEFDLEFNGVGPDPWGGTRAGFTARTEINRKDWGIDFNMPLETGGVVVGEKVKIELEIEAIKA